MTRRPDWAVFLSPSAYRYFMQCVVAELEARGLAYDLWDGGLSLRDPPVKVGLVNLAQTCRRAVPPRWPGLVRSFVDQVLAAANEDDALLELVRDPARARSTLRSKLCADESLREARREDLVLVRVASALSLCVVWDLPTTVRFTARAEVAAWNLADQALVDLGLANVRASEPVERCALATDDGTRASELSGASHFAASHAMLLDTHLAGAPTAVVWVPNRHTVFFAAAADLDDARRAIRSIGPLAARAFQRGPGSLSPDPLWWNRGRLGDLPPA